MRERDTVSPRCRVALLGFGTVGSAVARRLTAPESSAPSNIQLTHIVDRRAVDKRASLPADGATIRQIAYADYDRAASALTAWIAPIEVEHASIFARTRGPQNAAVITGTHSGDTDIFGAGAGGAATAVAILGDITAIAKDRSAIVPPPMLSRDFRLQTSDFRLERTLLVEAV